MIVMKEEDNFLFIFGGVNRCDAYAFIIALSIIQNIMETKAPDIIMNFLALDNKFSLLSNLFLLH